MPKNSQKLPKLVGKAGISIRGSDIELGYQGAGTVIGQTTYRAAVDHQSLYDESLAQNGRTFHWARRFLGHNHGADAAQLYAFCRLLDDLADGDLPDGQKRLHVIASDLSDYETDPMATLSDPDMVLFAPFMHTRHISSKALRHLIDGLLFDQGLVHLTDEAALITYGYQVTKLLA